MAEAFSHGWPLWLAMAAAPAVGGLCGSFNGFLVTGLGLPSLAVTIGTLTLFRGISQGILPTDTIQVFRPQPGRMRSQVDVKRGAPVGQHFKGKGMPGFGQYKPAPDGEGYVAWAIQAPEIRGDKIVRPVVAGDGTHLPFVWILMACLGGFQVLGLVGLVVGPVALTLARELLAEIR
jgi:ribose/xylose/arabinose/galactoside ABC-type transport system permease subunit